MVYPVWSLKLNPLTPTSIGLLNNFKTEDDKIFTLSDLNDTEATSLLKLTGMAVDLKPTTNGKVRPDVRAEH